MSLIEIPDDILKLSISHSRPGTFKIEDDFGNIQASWTHYKMTLEQVLELLDINIKENEDE